VSISKLINQSAILSIINLVFCRWYDNGFNLIVLCRLYDNGFNSADLQALEEFFKSVTGPEPAASRRILHYGRNLKREALTNIEVRLSVMLGGRMNESHCLSSLWPES